jgi:hypothetical protein
MLQSFIYDDTVEREFLTLLQPNMRHKRLTQNGFKSRPNKSTQRHTPLSSIEIRAINQCVARVVPGG